MPTASAAGPGDPELRSSLLQVAARFRWPLVAATVLAVVLGVGLSLLQAPRFEATAGLLLADPRNAGVFREESRVIVDPDRYVRNQAQYVASRSVAAETARLLPGDLDPRDVLERSGAEASPTLDLIEITAEGSTARDAAQLADAVAAAYRNVRREAAEVTAARATRELTGAIEDQRAQIRATERGLDADDGNAALEAQREAAVAQLLALEARREQIGVDAALYGSGVELVEQAELPEQPTSPRPVRNGALAGLLGGLLALLAAWWRAEHAQSADDRHLPARVLHAPLLGEVPDFATSGVDGPLPAVSAVGSPVAEAYEFVLTSIEHLLRDRGDATVLVTSARPGDGKSVSAANLALTAARGGRRVALVDADVRARGLSELLDVTGPVRSGLAELAARQRRAESALHRVELAGDLPLRLVPPGTLLQGPASFFRTDAFRTALAKVREHAELVVVDTPPLLGVSDASAAAAQADGIVLVVPSRTPMRLLRDVRHRLDFVGTPLLGYVFNRAEPSRTAAYGYGTYGSHGAESGRSTTAAA